MTELQYDDSSQLKPAFSPSTQMAADAIMGTLLLRHGRFHISFITAE